MEKFKYVSQDSEGKVTINEVDGERVKPANTDCFIFHQETDKEKKMFEWNVTHLETGMRICLFSTRDGALALAYNRITKFPEAIERGRKLIESLKIKLPINNMETETIKNTGGFEIETPTMQAAPVNTEISIAQTDIVTMEAKRVAWGKIGVGIYTTELKLQAMAQKAINSLVYPKTIQDIPHAEEQLKTLSAKEKEVTEERMKITSIFRDVADRLMLNEKSFAEPKKKLTELTITLKKKNDDINNAAANRTKEAQLLKEQIIKHCADLDAKIKLYINEMINKYFIYSLEQSIPIAEINSHIKRWSDAGCLKIMEFKFKAIEPKVAYITMTEAQEIIKNNFNIHLIDYKNTFEFAIRDKFRDYEVAFLNKSQALQANALEKAEADKKIADAKLNTEITASIEANVSVTPTQIVDTKALKKTYEVDMPETVDNALLLFSAFAANKEKCLAKLNVKKWFSFNASQVAAALGKIKSDDNTFQPSGIIFKEGAKL